MHSSAEILALLPDLYGAALRFTRNPADAEDLVAEALKNAWSRLSALRDRGSFRGWIFRILTNAFLSERRARRSRPDPEPLPEGDDSFSLFERLHQPFLLWWGNPEQEFLNRLLREDIERAIQALPDSFRVVVILADLEGFYLSGDRRDARCTDRNCPLTYRTRPIAAPEGALGACARGRPRSPLSRRFPRKTGCRMKPIPIFECEQVLLLILAYLDGEVDEEERRGVAEHLDRCRSCFSRAEFERRLKEHLVELGRESVPPALLARVRTMMRQFGP